LYMKSCSHLLLLTAGGHGGPPLIANLGNPEILSKDLTSNHRASISGAP